MMNTPTQQLNTATIPDPGWVSTSSTIKVQPLLQWNCLDQRIFTCKEPNQSPAQNLKINGDFLRPLWFNLGYFVK